jgi:hypothetical protein
LQDRGCARTHMRVVSCSVTLVTLMSNTRPAYDKPPMRRGVENALNYVFTEYVINAHTLLMHASRPDILQVTGDNGGEICAAQHTCVERV